MKIDARPYDDFAALQVFRHLDRNDLIEAQVVRGAAASHLSLFGDWRAAGAAAIASFVLHVEDHQALADQPFAVLALAHTGQTGVAQAAFLARSHGKFRGPIARAAVLIRQRLPHLCADTGIHRIEARCFNAHPTAPRLLTALGFQHECTMAGFGARGANRFRQYAYLSPTIPQPEKET